jgi:hypothetical protein
MGIFREESHKIIIDPAYKTIPEFAALISRDKSKDKRTSFQELCFVFFVTDYKSPYSIYPHDEKIARVKREVGFDPDWIPDLAVEAAVNKYDQFQLTPSISSLIAIRESLMTSTKVIKTLRAKIDERLLAFNTPSENADDESTSLETINAIVASVQSLLVLADKLPKTINTLEELEEKVKKEQSNEKKIRGGGSVNSFED